MLPEEFLEYARKFDFGFLVTLRGAVPVIDFVDFEITGGEITLRGSCKEGRACLVFANERYSENSLMAQVTGELMERDGVCTLVPSRAFWTYPFSLDSYPKDIIKRWRR